MKPALLVLVVVLLLFVGSAALAGLDRPPPDVNAPEREGLVRTIGDLAPKRVFRATDVRVPCLDQARAEFSGDCSFRVPDGVDRFHLRVVRGEAVVRLVPDDPSQVLPHIERRGADDEDFRVNVVGLATFELDCAPEGCAVAVL